MTVLPDPGGTVVDFIHKLTNTNFVAGGDKVSAGRLGFGWKALFALEGVDQLGKRAYALPSDRRPKRNIQKWSPNLGQSVNVDRRSEISDHFYQPSFLPASITARTARRIGSDRVCQAVATRIRSGSKGSSVPDSVPRVCLKREFQHECEVSSVPVVPISGLD